MLAVLRFTFSKDLKFVVSVSPLPVLISYVVLLACCTAELSDAAQLIAIAATPALRTIPSNAGTQ